MMREKVYAVEEAVDAYRVADDENALVVCGRSETAHLIAALMNGDVGALLKATEAETAACRRTLTAVLDPLRSLGRPALPSAFPLM